MDTVEIEKMSTVERLQEVGADLPNLECLKFPARIMTKHGWINSS